MVVVAVVNTLTTMCVAPRFCERKLTNSTDNNCGRFGSIRPLSTIVEEIERPSKRNEVLPVSTEFSSWILHSLRYLILGRLSLIPLGHIS